MYTINNISFDTDGKTLKVPPEKGKGKIILATSEDLENNREEYMQYNDAYNNTIEDVKETSKRKKGENPKGKEGTGRGE